MRSSFILIFLFFLFIESYAQVNSYSVLFYNTENFFDWKNDLTTDDDEFTPDGDRHWTYQRFQKKINNISKALIAASGWDVSAVIGLCEVENHYVLEQLISETSLKNYPLRIIHKESPDPRGIDVARIYNKELFHPVSYEYFPLVDDNGRVHSTREILHVEGVFGTADTVHFFINHWPSRYSGLLETKEWRNRAASLLKQKTDALFLINARTKIIILGDFNDQPGDESIQDFLLAKGDYKEPGPKKLYNLSDKWGEHGRGSLKYQSQWFVFDQIIVSGELLKTDAKVSTKADWANIVRESFLLEKDDTYGGEKPNRTYNGFRYHGGFSDHFPVKLKLVIR